MKTCQGCGRELNKDDDCLSEDLGGDCISCMASAGDPGAIEALLKIASQRDALLKSMRRISSFGASKFKGDFSQAQIAKDAIEEVLR